MTIQKKKISKRKPKRKNPPSTWLEKIFGTGKKYAGQNDASIKVEDGRIFLTGGFGDLPEAYKELNDLLSKTEGEIKFEFQPNSSSKKYVLNKLELKFTEQ